MKTGFYEDRNGSLWFLEGKAENQATGGKFVIARKYMSSENLLIAEETAEDMKLIKEVRRGRIPDDELYRAKK